MEIKKHTPSKMQLADLEAVAKHLKELSGEEHLDKIMDAYGTNQWAGVNEYPPECHCSLAKRERPSLNKPPL